MQDRAPTLFRDQALQAARAGDFGRIVLIRPVSFTLMTSLAVILASVTAAFLTFGSYTRRSTVEGQLVCETGLVRVYAPQAGIVLEQRVAEGQAVHTGDVLFVLSSERSTPSQGATQAAISATVQERRESLRAELSATRLLQQKERAAVSLRIDGQLAELATLDSQIQDQHARVQLMEDSVSRYQRLKQQNLVSVEQLQQRTADLLALRGQLQDLQRDRIGLQQELAESRAQRDSLPLKEQNQLSQIDRALASASEELVESEAKRRLIISAPESGTATAVLVSTGQSVDGTKPLVSIVPAGTRLRAELYAPSRAVGFIRPGDSVLVRYQAFPFEKFGHQPATVESVARTALTAGELNAGAAPTNTTGREPLYRIMVRLHSQSVLAYGHAEPLQPGMLLEADVLHERRRLYEWVFEPLLSVSGKL